MKRILVATLAAVAIVAGMFTTSTVATAAPAQHKAYTIAYVANQINSGAYKVTPARKAVFTKRAKAHGTTFRFERDIAVCEATIKTLVKPNHKRYGVGDPMARALSDCINMVIESNNMVE